MYHLAKRFFGGDSSTLNMETSCASETSKTIYVATPRHIPEELNLCKIYLPVHIFV
jgi:hypothetical protein